MLDTDYQRYYIYKHQSPDGEIVYIGKGTQCRAFRSTGSGHRQAEHSAWLNYWYNKGVIPVEFIATGLSKKQAHKLETKLIKEHTPKFNKVSNPDYKYPSIFNEGVREVCKDLRDSGYYYSHIAILVGGDRNNAMTVWRLINE